ITAALGRGKVDVSLRWEKEGAEAVALDVNETLVGQLRDVHASIGRLIGSERELSAMDMMRWPGVIREQEQDFGSLHQAALDLLSEALAELRSAREAEGERIAVMLETRAATVADIVVRVRERLPQIRKALREKFEARLAELAVQPDTDRLEQELVYH